MKDIHTAIREFEEEEGLDHARGPSFEELFSSVKTASAKSLFSTAIWEFEEEEGLPHARGPSFEELFSGGKSASAKSRMLRQKAKTRWDKDEADIDKLYLPALANWNAIMSSLSRTYAKFRGYEKPQGRSNPDDLLSRLKKEKKLLDFGLKYFGDPSVAVSEARTRLAETAPKVDRIKAFANKLRATFIAAKLKEYREPLEQVLPEEFFDFFPPTMAINLDPNGQLKELCSRFGNQMETLEVKHQKMLDLMSGQSQVLATIQAGLSNPLGSLTNANATALSILFETGIRPGGEGGIYFNHDKQRKTDSKDPNGVFTPTYGVTDLEVRHITFSGGGASLKFEGKMFSTNKAVVRDPKTVRSLKNYVDWAESDGVSRVLRVRESSGVRNYDYNDIKKAANKFDGLNPTDFRKYKATTATYNALKEQQADLYSEIMSYADSPDIKVRIVKSIQNMVSRILKHAQQTLSHDDVETTIDAYLNPRVLLRFLSTASVESSLKKQVASGDFVVFFDPVVFLKAARAATGG